MEWKQLDHIISDPFLTPLPASCPLDLTTPIFELGLNFVYKLHTCKGS